MNNVLTSLVILIVGSLGSLFLIFDVYPHLKKRLQEATSESEREFLQISIKVFTMRIIGLIVFTIYCAVIFLIYS